MQIRVLFWNFWFQSLETHPHEVFAFFTENQFTRPRNP
ncbi:hypothetical protein C943_04313 [Mariniradius saccharolyticus AK6]|uniref:Uncharacterized protein n=1 Tax=Mariniradius saccharolyticus AK6 TaxID=1239962 RepID=M7X7S6_9BACT|nr:hypothetical protein C943_04313 [Mariniradius saccharolyticus AK6]